MAARCKSRKNHFRSLMYSVCCDRCSKSISQFGTHIQLSNHMQGAEARRAAGLVARNQEILKIFLATSVHSLIPRYSLIHMPVHIHHTGKTQTQPSRHLRDLGSELMIQRHGSLHTDCHYEARFIRKRIRPNNQPTPIQCYDGHSCPTSMR